MSMQRMRRVVVSGLPASGKSTVARAIARRLGWAGFDKDTYLEARFEPGRQPDLAHRAAMSREADAVFLAEALAAPAAVLTSWWRHPRATQPSGTPVEALAADLSGLVEVHCDCPPALALQRFRARVRLPGHADALRTDADLARQFAEAAALGPLWPHRAWRLDTARSGSAVQQALDGWVAALGAGGPGAGPGDPARGSSDASA